MHSAALDCTNFVQSYLTIYSICGSTREPYTERGTAIPYIAAITLRSASLISCRSVALY